MTRPVSARGPFDIPAANGSRRLFAGLLAGTMLAGLPAVALAQADAPQPQTLPQPLAGPVAAPGELVQSITVSGAQRLEPDTIRSYVQLRVGEPYTQAAADQALKDLYATELFSDVQIRNNAGNVVIEVRENPVINRVILEGNKKLKDDKITPEIKLAPRQIFTRSKVRADVARIIELYKRQGRFAASVEPKMVMLEQNRVDVVFEIEEGPKSKVRQINIIGNEQFSDSELRGEMVTKQARLTRFFSSSTSYDPDRLAFDQQKLRQFYLTNGYADFRVVSAVAELTPDKKDFIITYVVEEGQRYKFGDVKVESQLREFSGDTIAGNLPMKQGQWYNAKQVEDTVEALTEQVGAFGYAFADVRPQFERNRENLTMDVTFVLNETPRVYVERVDVNGNTITQDKVIRREFRLAEGDAFNSLQVKRSTNRINSLGYFQEKFEVEQKPGSAPDRIVLEANVEEKATGELQLSAGFSSLESFIVQGSIRQRNFRGRGQSLGASVNYSRYAKSAEVSFTEPYVFDRNVSAGLEIYRRDYNSFNFVNDDRNTTYEQTVTGFQGRLGVPLTEYLTGIGRYTFNYDDVSLGNEFLDPATGECDPIQAGRYLCDAIGKRTSSILGLSLVYDTLNNRLRPSRGHQVVLSTDFAGLGGSVKYARARLNGAKYWPVGGGFIFSVSGEGGIIKSLENRDREGVDDIRLTDRFYLGEPQIRGFDIRGVGPRVQRIALNPDGTLSEDRDNIQDDALGGKYYYLAHAELEIPLGSGARELGLRPSIFVDAGAVFGITRPQLIDIYQVGQTLISVPAGSAAPTGAVPISTEVFLGDSPKPRVSIGVGVNWNSPFGPFRIDFARALLKEEGDDTKAFTFNVGTQF